MSITLLIHGKKILVKSLELAVIALFAGLVLVVLWGVLSRASGGLVLALSDRGYEPWSFLPRGQARWSEEAAIFLLMWVSLLGGSVAYGAKSHLGVDYFVGKLAPNAQLLSEGIVHLVVMAFAAVVLLGGGYILVSETLRAGQVSPALKLKVGYMYMAVPISGAFIVLFCLERIIELVSGKKPVIDATH